MLLTSCQLVVATWIVPICLVYFSVLILVFILAVRIGGGFEDFLVFLQRTASKEGDNPLSV